MYYKVGHCPQCGIQVMVQDTNGRWNSFKSNYRQADLYFEDGHRVRTVICEDCLENPDFQKIMDSLLHKDSQAGSDKVKDDIRYRSKNEKRGLPVKIKKWGLRGGLHGVYEDLKDK